MQRGIVIRLFLPLVLWLFCACEASTPWRKRFAPVPPKKTTSEFSDFEQVISKEGKVLGYLEKEWVQPAGSLEKREQYFVYDANVQQVGYITHSGSTYRFLPDGDQQSEGTLTLRDALRTLLRHPGLLRVERLEAFFPVR